MFKVIINNSELYLASSSKAQKLKEDGDYIVINYYRDKNQLIFMVKQLELSFDKQKIVFVFDSLKMLKKDFKSLFININSAGGFVQNENKEVLMIHKNMTWGLPKGTVKENELKYVAAIREVKEETGIIAVTIVNKLCKTREIKRTRYGKRILKTITWFQMQTTNQILTPLLEEGIDDAKWINLKSINSENLNIGVSFYEIIRQFEKKHESSLKTGVF